MTQGKTLNDVLSGYLPSGCSGMVTEWFGNHRVVLRITRSRRSKLGDFRGGSSLVHPRITINHDLNQYSFLITLIHEMAHAELFLASGRRLKPHGEQWKSTYRLLSRPFLQPGLLPDDILQPFTAYLKNPSASSTAYAPLAYALRRYDDASGKTLVSDLPDEALFALPDGRVFRRGVKLRKRYRCVCLNNKRIYLFSPLAEILQVESGNSASNLPAGF